MCACVYEHIHLSMHVCICVGLTVYMCIHACVGMYHRLGQFHAKKVRWNKSLRHFKFVKAESIQNYRNLNH